MREHVARGGTEVVAGTTPEEFDACIRPHEMTVIYLSWGGWIRGASTAVTWVLSVLGCRTPDPRLQGCQQP
jgi:hypothetical protein